MIHSTLSFLVFGKPRPQGSKKAIFNKHTGKAFMIEQVSGVKPYRQDIAGMALAEIKAKSAPLPMIPKPGSVYVKASFYFQRPKNPKVKRSRPTVTPDADKLARAVLDALTGIVFTDDSQVAELEAKKFYGLPPRTEIQVGALVEEPNG